MAPVLKEDEQVEDVDDAVAVQIAGDGADGAVLEGEVRAEIIPFRIAAEWIDRADGVAAGSVIAAGRVVGLAAVAREIEAAEVGMAADARVVGLLHAEIIPLEQTTEAVDIADEFAALLVFTAG